MISLNYLKYLFNSKKYLLIFVGVLEILCFFRSKYEAFTMLFSVSIVLSYVISVDVFSYLHDKKAVDSYFCLPISRKQLLYTGLLFSCLVVSFLFGTGYIVIHIINKIFSLKILLYTLVTIVGFICLITFNVMLFQIGNTMFDGIVMIGAYSFLPFVVYIAIVTFFENYVCGFTTATLNFEIYFSSIYMLISNFANSIYVDSSINYYFLLAEVVILLISLLILSRSFINRKVERANSPSKEIFAYPLIMNVYAFMLILCVACTYNYSYDSFVTFISSNAIVLLVIFALYICAHFVYKRSFYLNLKMTVTFICLLAVCFVFAGISKTSNGFGLANTYNKENINYYELSTYNLQSDLRNKVETLIEEESDYLDITIIVNEDGKHNIDKEVVELFEGLRKESIDDFYSGKQLDKGRLVIMNDYVSSYNKIDYSDEYWYYLDNTLDFEDIMNLAKYDYIKIYINSDLSYFELNKDGSLSRNLYEETYEIF